MLNSDACQADKLISINTNVPPSLSRSVALVFLRTLSDSFAQVLKTLLFISHVVQNSVSKMH